MNYNSLRQQNFEFLKAYCSGKCSSDYSLQSRIHPLRSLSAKGVRNSFLKRDDELSFAISGSKIRKYASLLPYLKRVNVQEALLVGGAYSNNVLGLSQLLIENAIKPRLLLRKAGNEVLQGNRLLIELLVAEEAIHWIPRQDWPFVEKLAHNIAEERFKQGIKVMVIPEGALLPEAFDGALTLSLDIVRNEIEHNLSFDHLFVDAGSGLQAMALILGMSWLQHPSKIHVILLADDDLEFLNKLKAFHTLCNQRFGSHFPFPNNFCLHKPTNAPSFGAVNGQVFDFIAEFARVEGVFLDPIYSAKLVYESRQLMERGEVAGNTLLIHSGGGLSLSGFQPQLRASISG